MFMAKLWKEAGLPDGVFNVVHGDKEVVDALLTHKGIKSISFVGSTPIARYVYEAGTSSRNAKSTCVRLVSELWRHSAKAMVAALTARSTVAALPNATLLVVLPVAGL